MENKEAKEFYVIVKGQKVTVTEKVYRAYVRPIRAEQRANRRNWRCMVQGERGGLVRCKKDCSTCPFANNGNNATGNNLSLETLQESGWEMEDRSLDLEEQLIEKEEREVAIAALRKGIDKLNDRQKYIVEEIYFKGKTPEQVRAVLGIGKSTMYDAIQRILATLKKFMEEK